MIRNLKLWQKFLLIAVLAMALCTPPTLLLVLGKLQELQTASAERAGVAPVGALLKTIRLVQVHRGLSSNWLGGNAGLQASREARAAELDQAMAAMLEATAVYPGGRLAERRGAVQQQWQALRAQVAQRAIDGPTAFQRHSALVSEQLRLLGDVADRSQLMLDPEAGTYYLIAAVVDTLPKLGEQLAQARGLGALYLNRKAITPGEQARLQAGLEQVAQLGGDAERYFRGAAEGNPALAAALEPQRVAAEQAAVAATALVRSQLTEAAAPDAAAAGYFDAMSRHIDAQYALLDTSFQVLDRHLAERIGGGRQLLTVVLAGIALVMALAGALMVAITRSTIRTVASAQAAADALAQGHLDHRVQVDADDEIGRMASTLGRAMAQLRGMVLEIKSTGESVGTASAQIAAANTDLSARTEHTASNLQEAASSMEQLNTTVRNNADAAQQATALAGESSRVAAAGGELIGRVVATMEAISASSSRITDIVGVIDGIAFQTNILALNAAVEAARAGEQGRGFAVVASEVRSLAQRSAGAAREIKGLISASVTTVHDGAALVAQAQQTMGEIVGQARQVSTLVGEIGQASSEQTQGIAQVNVAVTQLDQATQQNAALVEESAAAADSLRQQASRLVESVSRFRLGAA